MKIEGQGVANLSAQHFGRLLQFLPYLGVPNDRRNMKVENTKPIRVEDVDYEELKKLKEFTGIPIVRLIHFAIPLLKKKYKFKEEERGTNGSSKL